MIDIDLVHLQYLAVIRQMFWCGHIDNFFFKAGLGDVSMDLKWLEPKNLEQYPSLNDQVFCHQEQSALKPRHE